MPEAFSADGTGAIRMPMMAIPTRSSTKVNAPPYVRRVAGT
jgi:hypothetical protein